MDAVVADTASANNFKLFFKNNELDCRDEMEAMPRATQGLSFIGPWNASIKAEGLSGSERPAETISFPQVERKLDLVTRHESFIPPRPESDYHLGLLARGEQSPWRNGPGPAVAWMCMCQARRRWIPPAAGRRKPKSR